MKRVEEALTELLYYAEYFSTTGASIHDMKIRRRYLLDAARAYGRAMDNLGRRR